MTEDKSYNLFWEIHYSMLGARKSFLCVLIFGYRALSVPLCFLLGKDDGGMCGFEDPLGAFGRIILPMWMMNGLYTFLIFIFRMQKEAFA